MTTTPGYLSNAELAQRISALVDRWNTRENQMIALLTQPEGEVTVTDGLGANHVLPSFPQIQKDVSQMTDELTGAVAEVRDLNSVATAMAVAAEESAVSAGTSAADANTAATSAAADSTSAAASAVSASQAEQTAGTHAQNSVTHADAAHVSAGYAAQSASESSTQANLAIQARAAAESARDLSQAYAVAPEGTEVVPGEYSAYHWAKRAESTATGNVIYMGLWSPASGSYPAAPVRGHMYRVSDSGSFDGVGYAAGDQILYNGTAWDRVSTSSDVQSVAGKTGAVLLVAGDVGGLGALATRNDADWSTQVTGKPVSFPPHAHSHSFDAITGKPETATRWPAVSEVSGLDLALASKAGSHSLTSTGGYFSVESYSPASYGVGKLETFYDANNVRWNIGARDSAGNVVNPSVWVGGHAVWHAGTFNPDSKADISGASFTGEVTVAAPVASTGAGAAISFADRTVPDALWQWYAAGGTAHLWRQGSGNRATVDADANLTSFGSVIAPAFNHMGGPRVPRIFVQPTMPTGGEVGDIWIW